MRGLVHVDDEESRACVTLLIRMLQDVQDVSAFDVVHDLFKGDATFGSELLIFCGVP